MKKILLITLISIIIITLSILIIKRNKKETPLTKITVAEVTHSVFYAPWYVSIENDYFKEENIEIDLILTPGADKVASAVLSGDANIGFSGPEATMYVLVNGSNERLFTFASLTKRDGQFIVGDCSLKESFKIEDLKGKTVLAGRSGGMPLMMFNYALKEANLEGKVKVDTSVEFASLTGAYISKQGDFVNLFEPNALNLEKENLGCALASLGNLSGVVPYTTFYVKESYIYNNETIIKGFIKAINKGLTFVKENTAENIAKIILPQFPDTSLTDLTKIVQRYKDADSWYETTYINEKDMERLMDIMIYGNNLKEKIDTALLITNEYN